MYGTLLISSSTTSCSHHVPYNLAEQLMLSAASRCSSAVGCSSRDVHNVAAVARARMHGVSSRRTGKSITVRAGGGKPSPDDEPPQTGINTLEVTIRRKQRELESTFKDLGMEGIDERLQSAVSLPTQRPYRLARLIADKVQMGECTIIMEVFRQKPESTTADVVALAKACEQAGADAISVRVDSYDTPEGLKDMFAVVRAVKIPVLARDWYIHPLQLAESKEAGVAGVIGIINQITGKATSVMSAFVTQLGLDAFVEVVNLQEVEDLYKKGVTLFGINLGVGLSISMPGLASQMAHGMLGNMPFGTLSLVGVRTIEEAQKARASGADSLLIKKELVSQYENASVHQLVQNLQYITSGDD